MWLLGAKFFGLNFIILMPVSCVFYRPLLGRYFLALFMVVSNV